jgi:hypothetical protein
MSVPSPSLPELPAGRGTAGTESSSDDVYGGRFGLNVGEWMRAYPEYILQGGFEGFGYVCWRRNELGRSSGPSISALSLDELADVIDLARGADAETRPQ